MHADEPRLLRRGNRIVRIRHSKRREDVFAEINRERLAADRFDGTAGPVEIDAVLSPLTGVEHQWQAQ